MCGTHCSAVCVYSVQSNRHQVIIPTAESSVKSLGFGRVGERGGGGRGHIHVHTKQTMEITIALLKSIL